MEDGSNKIIPVERILAMVETGSEMNGSVVTIDHESKLIIGRVGAMCFQVFHLRSDIYMRFATISEDSWGIW